MADFLVNDKGVFERWKDENDKVQLERVSSRLNIPSLTRDQASGNWGRLLEWEDADGEAHRWVMHQAMLSNGIGSVIAFLLAGGLKIEPNRSKSVIEYIQSVDPSERITIVTRTGWHCADAFVLPNQVISSTESDDKLEYAPAFMQGVNHLYRVQGTLEDWQRNVGALCSGNPLLLFCVSVACSGPTLAMLQEEGGGFHIFGTSSLGKTTTEHAGGSVWGGGGQNGFLQSWRATANGLELTAFAHNDTFLPLDELGMLDPREATKVAYQLASGQSKTRMNADGSGQEQKTWRLQFLSTGEVTLDQLAQSVNQKTRGGMEVRLANIPADAGKGMGAFADIHSSPDANSFARRLQKATKEHYGSAGPALLKHLVESREECIDRLKRSIKKFETDHTPTNASGEVSRVVHRFALVSAAGELATFLDITGWEPGEAEDGAAVCLEAWLSQRGAGAGSGHDAEQMIRQVRHFIQGHRQSRFIYLAEKKLQAVTDTRPVHQAAGYYRLKGSGEQIFYFHTEVFRAEVCKSFDHNQVLTVLKQADHLVTDSGRLDKQVETRPKIRERFYAVRSSILFTNEDSLGEQSPKGKS